MGHIQTLTDPSSNTTTYAYNQLGEQTSQTNQLSHSRQNVYDANGNVVKTTDRNGRVRAFDYDALNRLTAERWPDGQGQTIRMIGRTYDADGRLTGIADSGGVTTTIAYDFDGRVHTVDQTLPADAGKHFVQTYGYDANGRTTSLVGVLEGVTTVNLAYAYDDAGRLTSITDIAGNKRVEFAYNGLGQYLTLTRYADAAGTELVAATTYDYDDANRLTSLVHALSDSGQTTLAYALQYDIAGRITQLTTPDGASDYTLDNTGQLTGASLTAESYTYDANGNRTSGGTVTDADNRITEDATYTYTYDDEGNLTRRTAQDASGSQTFAWDYRNRLTQVITKDGQNNVTLTATYEYDAFDRRVRKTVTGSQTLDEQYLCEGTGDADMSLVLDGQGNLKLRQLNAPGSNQVLAEDRISGQTTITRWAMADHEGSVRDVVDNTGTVVDHVQYDSFGNIVAETAPAERTRATYTGAPIDSETGFVYLHHRYLDAFTGRFVGQDAISFAAGDTNLYRYVGNDPMGDVDPLGLAAEGQLVWHHLASKSVFDPAKKDSVLNQLGLQLEEGLDLHSKSYGWELPTDPHSTLHSNANPLESRWETAQAQWLRRQAEEGKKIITQQMLDANIAEMKKLNGLVDEKGAALVGRAAEQHWPGTTRYYNALEKDGKLILENVTAPERLCKDIAERIPTNTWKKLAPRALTRGVKIVVGVGAVTAAYSGYNEARADGAPASAAAAVAVIEVVNPLPWSSVEIKNGIGEAGDTANTIIDESYRQQRLQTQATNAGMTLQEYKDLTGER